jgi:hypothetical protein
MLSRCMSQERSVKLQQLKLCTQVNEHGASYTRVHCTRSCIYMQTSARKRN